MCGIVGYVGQNNATPVLLRGLARLEYRGYDSAGLAVIEGGRTVRLRSPGKLANLENLVAASDIAGPTGIGHTRWATHGGPTEDNAHPHMAGPVSIVHNGIIENYLELRRELEGAGHRLLSDTDSEVVAHLLDRELDANGGDLVTAMRSCVSRLRGAFAIVAMSELDPGLLVAARRASPLVLGVATDAIHVASDAAALLEMTREIIFLEDGDLAVVRADGVEIEDGRARAVDRPVQYVDWSPIEAEKGGFPHFMLKEIHEQPRALADTLAGRLDFVGGDVVLGDFELAVDSFSRVVILACGTSHYAGMVARYLIEGWSRLPTIVEVASEYRYRDPVVGPNDLVVAISQSGETADTLAAVELAKAHGATVLAICNVVGSAIPRLADHCVYTHAGPEIGVASTKAFTTQLAVLALLALHLGRRTGHLDANSCRVLIGELAALPGQVSRALAAADDVRTVAEKYQQAPAYMFLGRSEHFPIALEGALKLKEISYLPAEGHAAGEMKHGPIARVDASLPIVALVTRDRVRDKMLSNLCEVRARAGRIIAITSDDGDAITEVAHDIIAVPELVSELQPVISSIPVQLLAYHTADLLGHDIDKPRNLAKSVTVE